MTNKEFNKMIIMFTKLNNLMKKYNEEIYDFSLKNDYPKPIYIPEDVYDEICSKLKTREIGLLGIS